MDEIDPEARKLGAVNTVVIENGKLRGFNTDGYGFAKAIKEEFNLHAQGQTRAGAGRGGAGRAIAVKCALDGARQSLVANRTLAKIEPIAREICHDRNATFGRSPLAWPSDRTR